MKLFNSTTLPNAVITWITPILSQFDFLNDNQPISAITYYATPIGGDVSYVVFRHDKKYYALITADHPDPLHDSGQLQTISKHYSFNNVITPAGNIVSIKDIEADIFLDDFFITGSMYYYCVEIKII